MSEIMQLGRRGVEVAAIIVNQLANAVRRALPFCCAFHCLPPPRQCLTLRFSAGGVGRRGGADNPQLRALAAQVGDGGAARAQGGGGEHNPQTPRRTMYLVSCLCRGLSWDVGATRCCGFLRVSEFW